MSSPNDAPAEPWNLPYDGLATAEDIHHCFRLLLGRPPNREEWRGHSSRVGEPLDTVVGSYVNSLEFTRRRLIENDAGGGHAIAELDGFRMFASPTDAAVGRHVLGGHYEGEVAAVFRSILRPGMGVIDIGANIGYFTMLSAKLVGPSGHVLAVEPNPANARMIEASRTMNAFAHVTVLQAAAGRNVGLLALNTSHSNGTTSTLEDTGAAILDARTVPCLPLDQVARASPRIGLIKVDVEGAEYNALLGCQDIIRQHRPVIVSEFSPGMLEGISCVSGETYLGWLFNLGYAISVIEPDGSLFPSNGNAEAIMAIYRARVTDHIDIVAQPTHAGWAHALYRLITRLRG